MSSSSSSSTKQEQPATAEPELSAEDIKKLGNLGDILNEEGPIVNVVFLNADGTTVTEKTDMTPRAQNISKRIGGRLTFIGQYHSIGVIVAKNYDQIGELNKHKLQVPFHESLVKGDIALIKNDEEGRFIDFTADEWTKFLAEKIDPAQFKLPQELDDEEGDVEEDDDEEKVEMGDDDEADGEEGDTEISGDMLLAHIIGEFQKLNNREPTADELKEVLKRIQEEQLGGDWGGDSEDDEDFVPPEDEEESEDDDEDGDEEGDEKDEDVPMENVDTTNSSSSSSSSSAPSKSSPSKRKVEDVEMSASPTKKAKA